MWRSIKNMSGHSKLSHLFLEIWNPTRMWYGTMKSCLKWRPVAEISELASSWDPLRFTGSVHLWHSLSSLAAIADTSCYAGCCCYIHFWQAAQGTLSWISHLSCFPDKPSHNLSSKTRVTIAQTYWVYMCLCMEGKKKEKRKFQKRTALWATKGSSQGYKRRKWKLSQIISRDRRDNFIFLWIYRWRDWYASFLKWVWIQTQSSDLLAALYSFLTKNEGEQQLCFNQQL